MSSTVLVHQCKCNHTRSMLLGKSMGHCQYAFQCDKCKRDICINMKDAVVTDCPGAKSWKQREAEV